ncbi:putative HNHc nuclease, partial [Turicibacter sanguinis]
TFVNDIPLTFKTFEVAKTVKNWSYLCFKNRKCTVCGKSHAVVHHLDTVGIGMNRNKVDHSKMLLIMVCQEHHQEAHNIGDETFLRKHKVVGIFVPVATLKALNIRGDYGEEANR